MKYIILVVALFFNSFHISFAQTFSSKNNKAIKLYKEAQAYKSQRNFKMATASLEEALAKDPDFIEAHLSLGGIHKLLLEDSKAKPHFIKASELNPYSKEMIPAYLITGEYLFNEGSYEKALPYFKKIDSLGPNMKSVIVKNKKYLENTEFAMEMKKHPLQFQPYLMDPYINQYYMQAFPVVTADGKSLIYSERAGPRPTDSEEIVICESVDGKWTNPVSISANINTPYNEGACSISGDGRTLVFTSCRRPDREGESCDIYIAYKDGEQWSTPTNMGTHVNTLAWESQPTLSADGRTIYFTSDRRGGYGKEDIYYTMKDEKGNWSIAKNIGTPINTLGSEVSPFIHGNGRTLFFSSDTHPGLGGFDIFYCEIQDSIITKPVNIGFPINNQINNISLFITADGKKGYYSEDKREGTAMNYTRAFLYEFDIPPQLNSIVKSNTYAKGKVFDAMKKTPLQASVELIDLKENKKIQNVVSDSVTGEYILVLNQGGKYGLFANKTGYLYKSFNFDITADTLKLSPTFLDLYLEPIKQGNSVVLNNIFFSTNSYTIDPLSKTELNKIIQFLKSNPKVSVEFGGYTDNIGDAKVNVGLSNKRAESVFNYIKTAGINGIRLKYKGFGEAFPKGDNNTEIGRAMNRRIEFKIL